MDIATFAARRRRLSLGDTIKLLFVTAHAGNDAGIATWAVKRLYDRVRPITSIQCLFSNKVVPIWAGFYKGIRRLPLSEFFPYQLPGFVTPPFPEYVSGHSTFSAAQAEGITNKIVFFNCW